MAHGTAWKLSFHRVLYYFNCFKCFYFYSAIILATMLKKIYIYIYSNTTFNTKTYKQKTKKLNKNSRNIQKEIQCLLYFFILHSFTHTYILKLIFTYIHIICLFSFCLFAPNWHRVHAFHPRWLHYVVLFPWCDDTWFEPAVWTSVNNQGAWVHLLLDSVSTSPRRVFRCTFGHLIISETLIVSRQIGPNKVGFVHVATDFKMANKLWGFFFFYCSNINVLGLRRINTI